MKVDRRALVWMGLSGGIGGAVGLLGSRLLGEVFAENVGFPDHAVIKVAFEFGWAASILTAALEFTGARLMGHQGGTKAVRSMLQGYLAGAVAGAIAQILYGSQVDQLSVAIRELYRVLCWGILTALAGLGIGLRSRLLGPHRGLGGGLLAGLLGGGAFSSITSLVPVDEHFALTLGGGLVGLVLGMSTVLAETAGRQAWLRVIWAPGEERILPLTTAPLTFGSDARQAQVLIRGIAPIERSYFLRNGRTHWTQGEGGAEHVMASDERHSLGRVIVEHSASAPGLGSPPPAGVPIPTHVATAAGVLASQPASTPAAIGWRLTGPSAHVQLAPGKIVLRSELLNSPKRAKEEPLAECIAHAQRADQLGLKNLSASSWTALHPGSPPLSVAPGRVLPLRAGLQVIMGSLQVRIDRAS